MKSKSYLAPILLLPMMACGITHSTSKTNTISGREGSFLGFKKALSIDQGLAQSLSSSAGETTCFSLTDSGYALHPCTALDEAAVGAPSVRLEKAILFDGISDATPGTWDRNQHELYALVKDNKRVGDMVFTYSYSRYYGRTATATSLRFICNGPYAGVCEISLERDTSSINTDPYREERITAEKAKEDFYTPH